MKWILKLLPNKIKVWLYKCLYDDIAEKGEYEDTELAHVNPYEVKILKEIGGSGRLNKATGLKVILVVVDLLLLLPLVDLVYKKLYLEKHQKLKLES